MGGIVRGLLGGLLGGAQKAPAPQPMIETPPPPTIDEARKAQEGENEAQKRRGRLSNIMGQSQTSAQLASNNVSTFSKRLLGE